MFRSSNPALGASDDLFREYYGDEVKQRSNVATLNGCVNKTAILVLITCVAGAGGYSLAANVPSLTMISAIAAFVIVLGMGFILRGKPQLAPIMGPIYAVVEGVFLGSLTRVLDGVLAGLPALQSTVAAGQASGSTLGLAMPAFLITISVMIAMLVLYYLRILKPTKRFQAIISTAIGGIMLTYLLMFALSLFGISMPFLGLASAFGSGWAPMIGIGLNVLILGVAALSLITDFGAIEDICKRGAPKYMEWYAGFILLVTLAWIYYEAVKLVFRLYVLFGSRD